ncbi:Acetyltransferase (GNAT) family protein [Trichlorobacter thiogenes]|uniref:Acetyltransferase (GNAT) family protein n=1 Tax=Trichlorobacter thiogenes TaxID=115783 RepID=A0A1T4MUJ7_9BACT|nr:GNAT family N-acetyltransferase [Trichlorobacter thiogenes]SJZ70662.1 Acetyltransferase (GNAT) family protein [Trichlorobacter thiogenes]
MHSTPRFKTATIDDIPALQDSARRIWHAHYPGIITVEQIDYMLAEGYSSDRIAAEMTKQGVTWLKILDDKEMIGFAAFGPYGEHTVKLHKLYLDVACHGRGIGSAALAEVEQRATADGATAIILNVNKYNYKAIASYERNGYQVADSVVNEIGNGFVMDDYVMKKILIKY